MQKHATHEDQGYECFEFLVYGLFGDEPGQFVQQDLQVFTLKQTGWCMVGSAPLPQWSLAVMSCFAWKDAKNVAERAVKRGTSLSTLCSTAKVAQHLEATWILSDATREYDNAMMHTSAAQLAKTRYVTNFCVTCNTRKICSCIQHAI